MSDIPESIIELFKFIVFLAILVTEIALVKELRESRKEMRLMRQGISDLIVAVGVAQLLGYAISKLDKWYSKD